MKKNFSPAGSLPVKTTLSLKPVMEFYSGWYHDLNTGIAIISDLEGRELAKVELTGGKGQTDVGQLHSGIYFVRVVSENRVKTGRFVKL